MKTFVLIFALVLAGAASAQEPIPQDKLQQVVPRLIERASDQDNLPLIMDLTAEKAVGMKIKEYGSVAIPVRNLSTDMVSKASQEITPVGQLWLTKLTPTAAGKPLPNEKLRIIKLSIENQVHSVQLLLLGLQKRADEELELIVFAKGSEPLLRVPLKKNTRTQDLPLKLDLRPGTESLGIVDIHVLGQFQASLPVAEFHP
jgi:hypothetical protein